MYFCYNNHKWGFTLSLLLVINCLNPVFSLTIEDTTLFDKPHFVIKTISATYLYDKSGGGFSSIIDREGIDWVQYNLTGDDKYPASAAGRFRGLPNFVFRSDDSGAGHPGFDKCGSEKVSQNEILTKSKSGKWQWRWMFFESNAQVTMEKVDSDHSYWFLYEGTPGGKYSPQTSYWGTNNTSTKFDTPNFQGGGQIYGHWQWAYFGEKSSNRVFFVYMPESDELLDTFSYLGAERKNMLANEGMVVFGFGRDKKSNTMMTKKQNIFVIGFFEKKLIKPSAQRKFKKYVKNLTGK